MLLLSNSQGNGPEYPDRAIYPWILQDLLNDGRSGPPVRVVNWSFGPNRVPEAIALLARAQELRPHVVLAVFHAGWFQDADYEVSGRPTPLAMFPGDVDGHGVALPRRGCPDAYRAHYLKPVTALSAVFARYWPTYRFRDLPVSYLQVNAPLVPAVRARGRLGRVVPGRAGTPLAPPVPAVARALPAAPRPELVEMFGEAAAAPAGAPRLRPPAALLPPGGRRRQVRGPRARARAPRLRGVGHVGAVPWRQFLEGQHIHLADDGHRTLAAALAERVRPLLPDAPRP